MFKFTSRITVGACLLMFLQILSDVSSCIIQKSDVRGTWDVKEHKRKFSACYCGDDLGLEPNLKSEISKPWQAYIHLKNSIDNSISTVCMGTVITSNLIATSAKCLTWKSRKINLYDAWNPKLKFQNAAMVEDLQVSTCLNTEFPENHWITVDKIIYHPRYIDSVINSKFPESDIALIRISSSDTNALDLFTGHDTCDESGNCLHRPICIPTYKESQSLLYRYAYYYGTGGDDSDPTKEMRGTLDTLILPGTDCDKDSSIVSNKDSVCVKFRLPAPNVEGGPLIVNSIDDGNTAYLAGLASWVGSSQMFPVVGKKYAYFSHIKSMVKYIEQQADLNKSKFCLQRHPPKFGDMKLPKPDKGHPWEGQTFNRTTSPDCVCGHSNVGMPSGRIVGGVNATAREYGWMVKLGLLVNTYNETLDDYETKPYICGGTLINSKMILTAGHCLYDDLHELLPPENITAYLSSHLQGKDPDEIKKSISHVIVHPEYDLGIRIRVQIPDVALLVLSEPVEFPQVGEQKNNSVVPICLPEKEHPVEYVRENATVAGWGQSDNAGTKPVLQQVTQEILPISVCRGLAFSQVTGVHICGGSDHKRDSAGGDSGGPLKIFKENHWIQVGVLSLGEPIWKNDKQTNIAALYTDVQKFLDFIEYHSMQHDATWCTYER